MITEYHEFLNQRAQGGADSGFNPVWMPDQMFDFQSALTEWAIRKGRAALIADCGLGKSLMGLTWASNVVRHQKSAIKRKPVLYLTPVAVGPQTIAEAEKFGIEAKLSRDGKTDGHIIVANYERLHYFDPNDFSGVVGDESSIIKNSTGMTAGKIKSFMRKVPYRLLQTATAAPNDYLELGTSSEALGYLGHMDMLNRFFKNSLGNSAQGRMRGQVIKWRLKGHAEIPFWRWVCSWARAIRKPSDLGFCNDLFVLPQLIEREHLVTSLTTPEGWLFAVPAVGLKEQREERRRTIGERCEKLAELVNGTGQPAFVGCHLNDEGRLLAKLIPDAVEVSGNDSEEAKEEKLLAFASGKARVLVTKPKIGAWGLNFQHCNHVAIFPSHSYEQYYQFIRRCYRFGQKRKVKVDIIATEGDQGVLQNQQLKARKADAMFANLVTQMQNALGIERKQHTNEMELPAWL